MSINLLKYLETVAETPSGVSYLRRLILDMAVHGRLSQNRVDESVAVLLKEIVAKKKKSKKSKKRKLTKSTKHVVRKGDLFSIPENWTWVQLREIGDIFHGNSMNAVVKKEKYTNVKNGIPYIGTKDVGYGWDVLDYENGVSVPKGEPKFAVAHKGAVLICSEGGSAGKKCGIADREICFGNKLIAIELYGGIVPDYVLSVYQTAMFSKLFSDNMNGLIGGISMSNFESLMIPLPPIAEQKRIVAKVNMLMKLCDKLKATQIAREESRCQLAAGVVNTLKSVQFFDQSVRFMFSRLDDITTRSENIKTLRQAILDMAMSGELTNKKIVRAKNTTIPTGWKWEKIEDVCKVARGRSITKKEIVTGEYPVIAGGRTPAYFHDQFNRNPNTITVSGSGASAGFVAYHKNYIFASDCTTLHIEDEHNMLNEFLFLFLKSKQDDIYEMQSGDLPHVYRRDIVKLNVLVPSLPEQERIVAKVKSLMAWCDKLESALTDLETSRLQYLRTHISAV